MLAKSFGLNADAIIFDLEDAVAPAAKANARQNIVDAIKEHAATDQAKVKTFSVRINDWSTPWLLADLNEIIPNIGAQIATIVLPKTENARQVTELDKILSEIEQASNLTNNRLSIELQIETASGIANIAEIVNASSRIETLIFGPADYTASMGMRSISKDQSENTTHLLDFALLTILNYARANNLQAIDGPFANFTDDAVLKESARRTAEFGFDGKWVIHPSQIETVNEVFTPTSAEVVHARQLLSDYQTATNERSAGAINFAGSMIDEASAKIAQGIIAKYEQAHPSSSTSAS